MELAKRLAQEWFGLNRELMLWVHDPAGAVHAAAAHASAWPGTLRMLALVAAGMLAALYVCHRRGDRPATGKAACLTMEFVVASALLGCAVIGLQQVLQAPWPAERFPGEVAVLGPQPFAGAFPSAQAAYAALLAALFWPHLGRAGRWAAAVLAVGVAVARIMAGASFPADALAGLLMGAVVMMGTRALLLRAELQPARRLGLQPSPGAARTARRGRAVFVLPATARGPRPGGRRWSP